MPRKLKPHEVAVVKHPSGVDVAICLDRNELTFFAEVSGKKLEHKDADELKRLVREEIDASLDIVWVPVICVRPFDDSFNNRSYANSSGLGCGTGFKTNRSYLARKRNGELVELHWDSYASATSQADRLRSATRFFTEVDIDNLPQEWRLNPGAVRAECVYLAHTEERWNALAALQERVVALQEQLKRIATREGGDLIDRISRLGVPALMDTDAGPSTQE